ncbi:Rab geranylgeranyltransferase [Taxawa tesnikishii (nom. ined.)]|nr:Rab geranylgeranyltransferase [Dothideales sp. JES 119]
MGVQAHEYTAETLALISKLLAQNPEYYTIWNYRRLLLQDVFHKELAHMSEGKSDESAGSTQKDAGPLTSAEQEILLLIKEDLAFLIPLLKTFPKCYWIWNHRSWLLQQASEHLPAASARQLWQGEFALVGKMLSYDSRNFHGWHYRREVVKALEDIAAKEEAQKKTGPEENGHDAHPATGTTSMTEQEFAYTTKMINTNLSNFSAWHNRLQLIPRVLNERSADSAARRKMLDDEFQLITEALSTDPADSSLWFYHQYLLTTLSPSVPTKSMIVLDLTNQDRLQYLEQEIDSVRAILDIWEDTDDCKWIYQSLLGLATQYMDIEAGNKKFSTLEMRTWLDQLEKLDPLRKGRWQDLRKSLSL